MVPYKASVFTNLVNIPMFPLKVYCGFYLAKTWSCFVSLTLCYGILISYIFEICFVSLTFDSSSVCKSYVCTDIHIVTVKGIALWYFHRIKC